MSMLPEDKWGTVIQNYTQLYGTLGDYNNQIKALEAARTKDPKIRRCDSCSASTTATSTIRKKPSVSSTSRSNWNA